MSYYVVVLRTSVPGGDLPNLYLADQTGLHKDPATVPQHLCWVGSISRAHPFLTKEVALVVAKDQYTSPQSHVTVARRDLQGSLCYEHPAPDPPELEEDATDRTPDWPAVIELALISIYEHPRPGLLRLDASAVQGFEDDPQGGGYAICDLTEYEAVQIAESLTAWVAKQKAKRESGLYKHASREICLCGMAGEAWNDKQLPHKVLELVAAFSAGEHSGGSACVTIAMLKALGWKEARICGAAHNGSGPVQSVIEVFASQSYVKTEDATFVWEVFLHLVQWKPLGPGGDTSLDSYHELSLDLLGHHVLQLGVREPLALRVGDVEGVAV